MKNLLISLTLLLAAVTGARGTGVLEAMQAGDISLSGIASSSYSEAKLTVRNTRSYSVDIDFTTACFVQNNTSQRIGLSYEKNTGAYYLRLLAGKTYTLIFSSRCLDRSRSSPSTGTAFSKVYGIGSQFSQIIQALRNKASQSAIWTLTDDSGSLSQACKQSDARYTAPVNPPSATGIDLSGSVSWRTSGTTINMTAGKVANLSSNSSTGSLRLRIWATRSFYSGGSISGYIMGTLNLNPLQAGYYYSNINNTVSYSRPASGTYYTTMTVEEYTNSGWVIRDYINFSGTTRF